MQYEERIIAFIDILGFKNFVNDESKCEDVGAILKIPYMLRQDEITKIFKIKGVMMSSISDSLVFSIRLKERGAMNKINKLLSAFTHALLFQYSLLLRGGITVGKIYHDNDIVFGPGLVKAYELECKMAIYPRIIMDVLDFERSILSCTQISQTMLRKDFVPDNDGFLVFDSFRYLDKETLEVCRSKLEQMKTSDLRTQQKVNWMIARVGKKL